jgi:hypothetical protein
MAMVTFVEEKGFEFFLETKGNEICLSFLHELIADGKPYLGLPYGLLNLFSKNRIPSMPFVDRFIC